MYMCMNSNISLSPHFQLKEFIESATARKHGIVNEPPAEAVENLKALCVHTLEPLREALGLPFVITSGYRCKALNDKIGHHSDRSQHMSGCAADFHVGHTDGTDNRRERLIQAFRQILTDPKITFDQVIIYPSFIHVSYVSNGKNRRKITKGYGNGKYCALTRDVALLIN
ncbi:MAG: hypothetical protein K6F78_05085 [Bacteroidaceae bacterium]|nr:hypothetical protein [Bacteroidaceae bacterium]